MLKTAAVCGIKQHLLVFTDKKSYWMFGGLICWINPCSPDQCRCGEEGSGESQGTIAETEKFRSDVLLHLAELAPLQPIMDVPYKFLWFSSADQVQLAIIGVFVSFNFTHFLYNEN